MTHDKLLKKFRSGKGSLTGNWQGDVAQANVPIGKPRYGSWKVAEIWVGAEDRAAHRAALEYWAGPDPRNSA